MKRYHVAQIRQALDEIVQEDPFRKDERVARKLVPRFCEDGWPSCLGAVVLVCLGVSRGALKQLDRELSQGTIPLSATKHAIRRSFDSDAWKLLCMIQELNDEGRPWKEVRQWVFGKKVRSLRYADRPWLTEDNWIE